MRPLVLVLCFAAMRPLVLVLCFAACVSSMNMYIMDLRSLITSKEDKKQLKKLEDDNKKSRQEIQQQLQSILTRQTQLVQESYTQIVTARKAVDDAQTKFLADKATQLGIGEIWAQVEQINQDMSLSRGQAKKNKKELVKNLGDSTKKIIEEVDKDYEKDANELNRRR